jgi:mono/diheme cytochrome c family protein/plastocyanin
MKPERLALAVLILLIVLIALGMFLAWGDHRDRLTLHARMAEQGGWDPATISARVGEPLLLHLTSDDVTHSFAVGQMDMQPVNVYPGEVTELALTFDRPGKYVYTCTRWCGPNHWRMRGTIEVTDTNGLQAEPAVDKAPLYVDLNLDIDAPHPATVTPQAKPSATEGMAFLEQISETYRSAEYLRSHSPAAVWQALRYEPFARGLDDQQVWDLAAALWRSHTSQARLELGAELYTQNCAACHGENGAGDGVFSNQVGAMAETGISGYELKTPTDFTDPVTILGASPALLQGKIVRGGMGTGMPYWGPIFTQDQIWAIVDYLYSFQFEP